MSWICVPDTEGSLLPSDSSETPFELFAMLSGIRNPHEWTALGPVETGSCPLLLRMRSGLYSLG